WPRTSARKSSEILMRSTTTWGAVKRRRSRNSVASRSTLYRITKEPDPFAAICASTPTQPASSDSAPSSAAATDRGIAPSLNGSVRTASMPSASAGGRAGLVAEQPAIEPAHHVLDLGLGDPVLRPVARHVSEAAGDAGAGVGGLQGACRGVRALDRDDPL